VNYCSCKLSDASLNQLYWYNNTSLRKCNCPYFTFLISEPIQKNSQKKWKCLIQLAPLWCLWLKRLVLDIIKILCWSWFVAGARVKRLFQCALTLYLVFKVVNNILQWDWIPLILPSSHLLKKMIKIIWTYIINHRWFPLSTRNFHWFASLLKTDIFPLVNIHISWSTSILETDIFPLPSIDMHHYYGWFGCGNYYPYNNYCQLQIFSLAIILSGVGW